MICKKLLETCFPHVSSTVTDKDTLMLEVFDWDIIGRDSLGIYFTGFIYSLGSIELQISTLMEKKQKGKSEEWFDLLGKKVSTGEVLLKFSFTPDPFGTN